MGRRQADAAGRPHDRQKAGLDTHPVMARTYVHLGAVYISGFKNREKGLASFCGRWR